MASLIKRRCEVQRESITIRSLVVRFAGSLELRDCGEIGRRIEKEGLFRIVKTPLFWFEVLILWKRFCVRGGRR
jgi:hypothetical protein